MAEDAEKIVIVNRAHAGQEVHLPELGKISLNTDGEVEVPTFLATQMVELGQGWSIKGDSANVNDELALALKKMTLEEMVNLAKKAQLDPEKYKKLQINETLMRNFLKKNLDALNDAQ
jgi:hypothetical protein